MIYILLLAKVTLITMDHIFTLYFNQATKLLQHFLVFHSQSQNGNLSKGLSNEKLKPPCTANKSVSPKLL